MAEVLEVSDIFGGRRRLKRPKVMRLYVRFRIGYRVAFSSMGALWDVCCQHSLPNSYSSALVSNFENRGKELQGVSGRSTKCWSTCRCLIAKPEAYQLLENNLVK